MERLRKIIPGVIDSTLNSYTQVFFSNNRVFAVILLAVSFLDFYAGLGGLLAILVSNTTSYLIGFNRHNIRMGYYGFNSLLVGLGLGIYYAPGAEFFLILLFTSVFTLFVTIMFEGIIGKYGLPYLSLSFLIGIWVVTLASREFSALSISERGLFVPNELYGFGGPMVISIYNWFNSLPWYESVLIYFRSLGAILFQYNLFAGILIAIGILIYSRISFLLSLIGFFFAYLFYQYVGGNIYELSYSYIGFNFILTSIAIGGFYNIPSKYSFLWVILITPLISITITSTMAVLALFQLSIFSLPFNIIVLLFMYILKFRERNYRNPEIVIHQQFSPEKNLYSHINNLERYADLKYIPVSLPFWGEWTVTQAHNGEFTHKEGWAHAWDFEIKDDNLQTFKNNGNLVEDYYCFNKPIIAPADGIIREIIDWVDDNEIGDMNLEQNWGNTIIVKHDEKLYSKLSHLKKNSAKVKIGEHVKKGDILGYVGNSGRSPEPHLHFQMQETPFIGSKTLDYPIGHYMLKGENKFDLKFYQKPLKGDLVSNIEKDLNLSKAFHFVPGQTLKFSVLQGNDTERKTVLWEVQSDMYNNTWIYCKDSRSKAWFKNDGNLHYFTHFEGNQKSLLFYFYLGAYKVTGGFYKNLVINDKLPVHVLNKRGLIFLQDFIAPFYIFINNHFRLEFLKRKSSITDSSISFASSVAVKNGNNLNRQLNFEFEIESKHIKRFTVIDGNRKINATEESTI
ncbi:MAG: urea transporter [Bacteroidales bacterium]|nr:urea transporter [Bacteroidales bacterium]MCF8402968.1 urea transporter [Bacteroidales bacterium]